MAFEWYSANGPFSYFGQRLDIGQLFQLRGDGPHDERLPRLRHCSLVGEKLPRFSECGECGGKFTSDQARDGHFKRRHAEAAKHREEIDPAMSPSAAAVMAGAKMTAEEPSGIPIPNPTLVGLDRTGQQDEQQWTRHIAFEMTQASQKR